jgi:hypothetical protein
LKKNLETGYLAFSFNSNPIFGEGEAMPSIKDNLSQFHQDLQSEVPIAIDLKSGGWERVSNSLAYMGREVANLNQKREAEVQRVVSIAKDFCSLLNALEERPIHFSGEAADPEWQSWLSAGRSVKLLLKKSIYRYGPSELRDSLKDLSRRLTALQYRMECRKPLDAAQKVDQGSYDLLLAFAKELKQNNSLYVEKELNQRDLEKIEEACRYPKFAKLLLESQEIRNFFLKSVIRDRADVDLFIQYPHLFEKLKNAYLIPRIGRFVQRVLLVEKRNQPLGGTEKIVTLPFWTARGIEKINILDDAAKVTFHEGWTLSIKEAFEVFAKKNEDHGDLEFFGSTGVSNWNSRELGTYIPQSEQNSFESMGTFNQLTSLHSFLTILNWLGVNPTQKQYHRILLDREEWWKQLPIFESLSKEEIEKRHPFIEIEQPDGSSKVVPLKLEAGEWLVTANSSRTTADLDLDDRHGYVVIYIPQPDGQYYCYPFGKFAEKFAVTLLEKVLFLVGTLRAKVAYPDENMFYSQRQHAVYPRKVSPEWGHFVMNLIRLDMIKAREKNLIFQFGADNCAHWVQSILEKIKGIRLPNLFVFPLLHSDPSNVVLKKIFTVVKQMPEKFRSSMLNLVDMLFGSWRGLYIKEEGKLVWKSHATNPLRKQHLIYQPGYLHKQIEEKILQGRIFSGH